MVFIFSGVMPLGVLVLPPYTWIGGTPLKLEK
jgi:hypothetical protein